MSIAHIGGDKALVLCQAERPRASQALMRHAWSDRAYPGGRETTPWCHHRCPERAPRAADPFLTPTRGAPHRSRIATASACMRPTPFRILHGYAGKPHAEGQGVEAAAGTGSGT